METKQIIMFISIPLIVCFGTVMLSVADEAYALKGEWDTVIDIINVSGWTLTEKDVVIISPNGNQFVGIYI